jgi:ribose/xylose/arabinose/galactoside ABC-type transport system permease subunit
VATTAVGVAAGCIADLAVGDPARLHPVAGFGAVAAALEERCWRPSRLAGACYAAVLVGGTAIQGGSGSVVRTLIGVAVIAIIEVVLLLRGFSQQLQYLITGIIVLAVIMLHTMGERR